MPAERSRRALRVGSGPRHLARVGGLCTLIALAASVDGQASDLLGPPSDGGPVIVDVGFFLSDVNEIDDERETFEFDGILTMSWTDPRHAFDPAETGYQERIFQGNYQFSEVFNGWWPQLFLANESGGYDRQGVMLRIRHDGRMTYVEEMDAVAEVRMNLRRFPFDAQRFDAVFEVLGLDSERVVLRPDEGTSGKWDDEHHRVRIPQWGSPSLGVSIREYDPVYGGTSDAPTTAFVAQVEMKREPGYVVRLVVFPLTVLVMLSWSVFWMDRASLGDRMDISFIGILTVVAYQITISGQIPKISYLTVLDAFLIISFVMMGLSVVINLLVGRLDQGGDYVRGDRVDSRCRKIFPALYALALLVVCGGIYLRN